MVADISKAEDKDDNADAPTADLDVDGSDEDILLALVISQYLHELHCNCCCLDLAAFAVHHFIIYSCISK